MAAEIHRGPDVRSAQVSLVGESYQEDSLQQSSVPDSISELHQTADSLLRRSRVSFASANNATWGSEPSERQEVTTVLSVDASPSPSVGRAVLSPLLANSRVVDFSDCESDGSTVVPSEVSYETPLRDLEGIIVNTLAVAHDLDVSDETWVRRLSGASAAASTPTPAAQSVVVTSTPAPFRAVALAPLLEEDEEKPVPDVQQPAELSGDGVFDPEMVDPSVASAAEDLSHNPVETTVLQQLHAVAGAAAVPGPVLLRPGGDVAGHLKATLGGPQHSPSCEECSLIRGSLRRSKVIIFSFYNKIF